MKTFVSSVLFCGEGPSGLRDTAFNPRVNRGGYADNKAGSAKRMSAALSSR